MFELQTSHVRVGLHAASREEAIRQVGDLLVYSRFVGREYVDSMLKREELASTYLGNGIAIPHGLAGDSIDIEKTGVVVAQFPEGVDWGACGRVYLAMGIAARSDEHLAVLARLSELLADAEVSRELAATRDPGRITAVLCGPPSLAAGAELQCAAGQDGARLDVRVAAVQGLHARPAAKFAEVARRYVSRIEVRSRGRAVNGKSMASLLQLKAAHGDIVTITAVGADATDALRDLKRQMEQAEARERWTTARSHDWAPGGNGSIRGVGASPGIAVGRIRLVVPGRSALHVDSEDPIREKRRLREAIASAADQLDHLYRQSLRKIGTDAAAIFLAHRELLEDAELASAAAELIDAGKSASYAWGETLEARAADLEKSGNAVLAGRAIDLRDVAARVMENFDGGASLEPGWRFDEPTLLVAAELTPSETIALDSRNVVGFCTAGGGPASHSAILARSLNIPAVVAAGMSVLQQPDGAVAIMDGDRGILYPDPSAQDIADARRVQQCIAEGRLRMYGSRFVPAITTDDVRVHVFANLGRVEDTGEALESGAEGVGLMRSEFLFLRRNSAPSEQEQYAAYRRMVEALGGLPLVLRTMDIGGDKGVDYLQVPPELNPFLGVRGIRMCLQHPDLFRTQLRAAYRASTHGPIKLMFPMISTIEEARSAKAVAEEIRGQLDAPQMRVGCMIEVPSAATMAVELASIMDFFSIGTNDLTQYMFAMDRDNPALAHYETSLHPAVFRVVEQVLKSAADQGKDVAVCGELAADPIGCQILLGLGVRELSVPPASVAGIKMRVRCTSMAQLRLLAQQALRCESAHGVRQIFNPEGEG